MKRIIISILAVLLLVQTLVSCGDSSQSESETSAAQQTEETTLAAETEAAETKLTADLPDKDFGGKPFTVLGLDHNTYEFFDNFEIYAESENGEIVNDAVYKRNLEIEEKYNVKIMQELLPEPEKTLRSVVTAGDDPYNSAFVEIRHLPSMATAGIFKNLNTLPYIDFTKPWWNSKANEGLSIGDKLYFTSSDFLLVEKGNTFILIFNKEMAKNYEAGDLYSVVDRGEWTAEALRVIINKVAADLDNDGKMGEADRFGIGSGTTNSSVVMLIGFGNRMTSKDKDNNLILTMNNERFISSIDKIYQTIFDRRVALIDGDFKTNVSKFFNEGRVMFDVGVIRYLKSRSSTSDIDYGVIPLPKYDENQEEYYTTTDLYGAMVISVPITSNEDELNGFMLEALSEASSRTTLPAYYETACKTKYTYDEQSPRMLDLICRGIVFDTMFFYDFGKLRTAVGGELRKSAENKFASTYASKESAAIAEIDKLVELYNQQ